MDKIERSQLRFRVFKQSKRTLRNVLILAVLVLMTLPFWTSLQSLLTQVVMSIGWYRSLQDLIVPHELRVTGTLLTLFKFPIRVGNSFIEWDKAAGGREVIYLAWNCVGWQTLVLFGITLITGLSGNHTYLSKLETLAIGLLGTYLVNTLRLVLVVMVYFAVGRPFGIVFHDYFSNLLTIGWLLLFWRFSYSFVLKEKQVAESLKS
jgi:exosortase/archaeosortase family protein